MEQMNPQSLPVVAQASPASMGGLDEQVYSRLLRERIIFLAGQVEDNMANAICAQILLLAAEDSEKDIYLYINSPGGSITAGMAIYDTMQYVKNDVATVATSFLMKCMVSYIAIPAVTDPPGELM